MDKLLRRVLNHEMYHAKYRHEGEMNLFSVRVVLQLCSWSSRDTKNAIMIFPCIVK